MNILTIDLEDWFHINFKKEFNNEFLWENYESRLEYNTDIILELLDEKKIKATFFCLGWIGRKHPNILKKIHSNGHEIGSHSDIHNLLSNYKPNEFNEDLKRSLSSLEDVIGQKVTLFRAPAFSIGKSNLWAFDIMMKNGIEIDCSVFPANHDFGGFPEFNVNTPFTLNYQGGTLKEFPMSTYNFLGKEIVVTGGGYFRFFPYELIKYFMKKSNYNMTYFHPRDLDADQPILENLDLRRRFKSYYGLKKSLNKFNKMINDFKFINISEAEKLINWNLVSKIKLD